MALSSDDERLSGRAAQAQKQAVDLAGRHAGRRAGRLRTERDTPEKHVLSAEKRTVIQQTIAELPEDMRSAIVLRDIQGFSYDEIAQMLEINVGTIKSRISRGREKLREKFLSRAELFDRNDV